MKKSPLKTLLAIALLFSLVGPVAAQAPSLAERFDRLDRNQDGKLTPQELPRSDVFQRLDRNGDGVIEKSELPTAAMAPVSPAESASEARVTEHLDIAYGDHERHKLDLYQPAKAKEAPIMVYIHGGGWRRGDKRGVGEKVGFFAERGWVLVSINYRLLPEGRHPANVNDAARALAWVHDHAADYGGDPEKLFVMGHSAGAHLAALVAASEAPLREAGKSRAIVRGVIPLDTNAYDVSKLMESDSGFYGEVFGEDPELWKDASPITHVEADAGIPPFLLAFSRGMGARPNPERSAQANSFADALRAVGIEAQVVDASDRNHGEINAWFGKPDDERVTEATIKFLNGILEGNALGEIQASNEDEPSVTFTRDYVAGSRDANGHFLGGTETMHLVAHDGKLFAGNGYWTDQPGDDPRPGAQILRKDGPDAEWRQERNFPSAVRVNAMKSLRFTTDHQGRPLANPVNMLVADAAPYTAQRGSGSLKCFTRNDETGEWQENSISMHVERNLIRVFAVHRDAVTGIDHIFAGTGAGEVYRGGYDPTVPGRLRWNPKPEYRNPSFDGGKFNRCQGFCVANGKLYASIAPRLVERQDGEKPSWAEVFRWAPQERAGAGLRGITAVKATDGDHQVIVGSREQEGRILRIDPLDDYSVVEELNSQAFLREQIGTFRGGKLVAYNRLVPGKHPATGKPIHWLSVAGFKAGDRSSAWLLIRNADATYESARVHDPNHNQPLISTRTIEYAPWNVKEIYTGGYDGAANNRKNHNTAWIYKGVIMSANDASVHDRVK